MGIRTGEMMLNSKVKKQLSQGLEFTTAIRLELFNSRVKLPFNEAIKIDLISDLRVMGNIQVNQLKSSINDT